MEFLFFLNLDKQPSNFTTLQTENIHDPKLSQPVAAAPCVIFFIVSFYFPPFFFFYFCSSLINCGLKNIIIYELF